MFEASTNSFPALGGRCFAKPPKTSRVGFYNIQQNTKRSGFSTAIGTKQTIYTPLIYFQVEMIDSTDAPVGFCE